MLHTPVCCRPERCRSHMLSVFSPCRLSLALSVFLVVVPALAVRGDEIGATDPVGWTGTYAGIRHGSSYADPPGPWEFVEEDDHIGTPNAVSEVPVEGESYNVWHHGTDGESFGYITASARSAPYGFNGFNASLNWYDPALTYQANSVQVGGYFRDELYFETVDGAPGYLEFDFHTNFSLELYEGDSGVPEGSYAKFQVHLLGYTGEGEFGPKFAILDNFDRSIEAGGGLNYFEFDDTVTLSTNTNGHLLKSGCFIPLSFTAWTYTNNGEIDWLHSVGLDGVRVYNADGELLGTDQYTLISPNDQYFPFNNEVPEPVSLMTFAIGLVGLTILIRKRDQRRRSA